jgi:preprotein translocase subunit SecG
MTFDSLFILASIWTKIIYGVGVAILFLSALVLVAVVLIQDSKEGGLGGAFGGAGGDSFLGAKAQKGITRFTAGLGIFFACLLLLLGKIDPAGSLEQRKMPGDPDAPGMKAPEGGESALAPDPVEGDEAPTAAAGAAPGETAAAAGETRDPVAEILGELAPAQPAGEEEKDPIAEILGELAPAQPAGETRDPIAEILGEPAPAQPAGEEEKDPIAEILGELMPTRPAELVLPPISEEEEDAEQEAQEEEEGGVDASGAPPSDMESEDEE